MSWFYPSKKNGKEKISEFFYLHHFDHQLMYGSTSNFYSTMLFIANFFPFSVAENRKENFIL